MGANVVFHTLVVFASIAGAGILILAIGASIGFVVLKVISPTKKG